MNVKIVDRYGLSEVSFRKHEQMLAEIARGSQTINPTMLVKPGKASSLKVALRDAIISFRRYGWKSNLIPEGYNFEGVKIRELVNGMVEVLNPIADRKAALQKVEQFSASVVIKNGEVTGWSQKTQPAKFLYVNRDNADTVFSQMVEDKLNGFDNLVIVNPAASDLKETWSMLEWELLNEGFYRVT